MSALRIPAGTTDDRDGLFGNVHLHGCHVAHLKAHANAYAETFVRSIKESCLQRLILFGEASLKKSIQNFILHYHHERNHQGKGNQLLFPRAVLSDAPSHGTVRCQQRLGGLLKYYHREAA